MATGLFQARDRRGLFRGSVRIKLYTVFLLEWLNLEMAMPLSNADDCYDERLLPARLKVNLFPHLEKTSGIFKSIRY